MVQAISIQSTHSLPSSWNKWAILGNSHSQRMPYDHAPPIGWLPTNAVNLASEINNSILPLPSTVPLLSTGLVPVVGAIGVELAQFIMRRSGSGGVAAGQPIYISLSPRVGVNAEHLFKQQAYISVYGLLYGISSSNGIITWTGGAGTASVEHTTYSRLKQLFLKRGKILSARTGGSSEGGTEWPVWLKILGDTSGFKSCTAGGNIKIWSRKVTDAGNLEWTETSCSFSEVSKDGEVLIVFPDADNVYVKSGDFFELEDTWLVNDPALMHEFEMQIRNGKYGTKGQLWQIPGTTYTEAKLVGVWDFGKEIGIEREAPDGSTITETYTVWTPYANDTDRINVNLPLPRTTSSEFIKRGENDEWGGEFIDGITLLKNKDVSSVRVLFNWSGNNIFENFCAGNLKGQYCQIADSWFEILDNPRGDTIEIKNNSVNSDVKLLDILAPHVTHEVYQQNFWLINQVMCHPTASGSLDLAFSGTVTTTTVGTIEVNGVTLETTTVKWKSGDSGITKFLTEEEINLVGADTLLERMLKKISIAGESSKEMYKKYKGWRIYDKNSERTYPIIDLAYTKSVPLDERKAPAYTADFTVTVLGDISGITNVALVFEETFDTLFGGVEGQNFAFVQIEPLLEPGGAWSIWMNGYYDVGTFLLEETMSKSDRFSLTNNLYGISAYNWSHMFPGMHIATRKRGFVSNTVCKHPLTDYKHVFFSNPYDSIFIDRFYKDQTKFERAVRTGLPLSLADINPATASAYVVTGGYAEKDPIVLVETKEGTKFFDSFWLKLPKRRSGVSSTFYYVSPISGIGGIETMLTKREGEPIYRNSDDITGYLPYEFSSPSSSLENGISCVHVPYYAVPPSGTAIEDYLSGVGLVSTNGKLAELNLLIEGGALIGSAPSFPMTQHEIVPDDRVVNNITGMKNFTFSDGSMLLVCGASWPDGSVVESSTDTLEKETRAIHIITSHNEGSNWTSPRWKLGGDDGLANDGAGNYQLAVIKDFQFVDGVMSNSSKDLFMFGYLFKKVDDENVGADESVGAIAMYKVQLDYLLDSPVFSELKKVILPTDTTELTVCYYRSPEVKIYDYDDDVTSLEQFTQIMGPKVESLNDVVLEHKLITPDISFCVTRSDNGVIRIYTYCPINEGIICLISGDSGGNWAFVLQVPTSDPSTNIENVDPIIYARGGTYPYVADEYLFYFKGKSLYVKRIVNGGVLIDNQEVLDNAKSLLIAENISPQKISGLISHDSIVVFYADENGNLMSLESKDGGTGWKPSVNW